MKHIILCICLALPLPALAQETGEIDQGFSLIEDGAKLLFRGLVGEVEPAIEGFTDLAEGLEPVLEMLASEIGPALLDLMQNLDSVRYYSAPEVLPNGDIILRRKPGAPDYTPPEEQIEKVGPIDL